MSLLMLAIRKLISDMARPWGPWPNRVKAQAAIHLLPKPWLAQSTPGTSATASFPESEPPLSLNPNERPNF
jgi:hypothetical protein